MLFPQTKPPKPQNKPPNSHIVTKIEEEEGIFSFLLTHESSLLNRSAKVVKEQAVFVQSTWASKKQRC